MPAHRWHGTVRSFSSDTARASYFAFLKAEFLELVASHDAMCRRKYAPQSVIDGIDARVATARDGIDLKARRTIAVVPRAKQLSLLPL